MHALAFPDTGLPMLPLVKGALPATSSEIVMHEETAERLDVQIGDTVTFADAKGVPAKLRISGLLILLASMGADLPCTSVLSMTGIMAIIPLAAFAMSTAPLRAR